MKPALYVPWLLLIFLTIATFAARTHHQTESSFWFVVPLVLAEIKISVIAWRFMELRAVSRFWIFGLGALTIVIFGILAVLQWKTGGSQ